MEDPLAINGVDALRAKKLICATCGHLKEDHCGAAATDMLDRYYLPPDMRDLLEDHVHCVGFFNNECAPQIVHPDTGKTHTIGTWRDLNALKTRRIEQPYMTVFLRELYDRHDKLNTGVYPALDDHDLMDYSSRSSHTLLKKLLELAAGDAYTITSTRTQWQAKLRKAFRPQAEWFVKNHKTTPAGTAIQLWLQSHGKTESEYINTHCALLGTRMYQSAAVCTCTEFRETPVPLPEDGSVYAAMHPNNED